jgi:hypothetical protein
MKTTSVSLPVATALGFAGASQAANFGLDSNFWGNVSSPYGWRNHDTNNYGTLPGAFDDASATTACVGGYYVGQPPCDVTYMTDTTPAHNPVQALVRSFDGTGRWLNTGTGASLQATYDSVAAGTGGATHNLSQHEFLQGNVVYRLRVAQGSCLYGRVET